MRSRVFFILLVLIMGVSTLAAGAGAQDHLESPPGQVHVVTINVKQLNVLGGARFKRLSKAAHALRNRPEAFDGGFDGGVTAPDVIVVQEISEANLDIFRRLLNQEFSYPARFGSAGRTSDIATKFLINLDSIQNVGDPTVWTDPCATDPNPNAPDRHYQFLRLREYDSGAVFVVAGIHLRPRSTNLPEDCRKENVEEIKAQVAGEQTPVIVAGDFNQRPVNVPHECDRMERSDPVAWWNAMTGGPGRAFRDAVRIYHHRKKAPLAIEWTYERNKDSETCKGTNTRKRARLDYIFTSDALVAEAHTDHPGWAGKKPGSRHPRHFRYSDHRFVWGRIVVAGPQQPARPIAESQKNGDVRLTWSPVGGATEWVIYRRSGNRSYGELAFVSGEETTFDDIFTESGKRYRYKIAARDASTAQGLESAAVEVVAE
jgi:endonuclease/exonuclease/phosphatase family metal-dependent hydrolase